MAERWWGEWAMRCAHLFRPPPGRQIFTKLNNKRQPKPPPPPKPEPAAADANDTASGAADDKDSSSGGEGGKGDAKLTPDDGEAHVEL